MEKKKRYIVFISDKFGYQCGGCTTVNYELCVALSQVVNKNNIIIKAMVINCDKKDRVMFLEEKAKSLGIDIKHQNILSEINSLSDADYEDICGSVIQGWDKESEVIWVGHDIFTGSYAIRFAKYTKGKSVVCIHTDYDTIEGLKGVYNHGIIKESTQRDIIQRADIVFAIGPRLMERVREVRKIGIYELLPGIANIDKNDIYNERAIIIYGRFEGGIEQVKQVHLALAAFGRAVAMMNNNRDYVLHIIGSPNNKEKEANLRAIAEEYAEGRKLSINFLNYTQDRKCLFACLKNNCAGLMISISEGFGLTGWEMISAGIPLILTKKSGLYDYLNNKFGYMLNGMCLPVDLKGSSLDKLCMEDVQAVAKKIVTVFKNPQQLRTVAEELREKVKIETWQKAASNLAKRIGFSSVDYGTVDIYSDTYRKRKDSLEAILNALEVEEMGNSFLIFFGGISRTLCGERAISKLTHWLERNPNRILFLCYETGMAANERAKDIDRNSLPNDGLSREPEQRMKEKEKLVEQSFKLYPERVRKQVTFIKLEHSPLTYTIIVDKNIYFTVLLQTRSSESMTMKIMEDSIEERKKIIESMEFIIDKQEKREKEKKLLDMLQWYRQNCFKDENV